MENSWSDWDMGFLKTVGLKELKICLADIMHTVVIVLLVSHKIINPFFKWPFSVKYIKSVDGWSGCYTGIVPKVTSNIIGSCALRYSNSHFEVGDYETMEECSDDEKLVYLLTTFLMII